MRPTDDFNLLEFLPYLLTQAAEESSLAFHKLYKARYGMLRTEWRVLFHLGIFGELTATEIGRRSKTHKTKISRAVAALERRRFLTRVTDEKDRRNEILRPTSAGVAAHDYLKDAAQQHNAALIRPLSGEDSERSRPTLSTFAKLD